MKRRKRATKKAFENSLNAKYGDNYGSKMRKTDPIQFDVLFQEWTRLFK